MCWSSREEGEGRTSSSAASGSDCDTGGVSFASGAREGARVGLGAGVARVEGSGSGEERRAAAGDWGAREVARVAAVGGDGERSLVGGRSRSGDLTCSATAVFVWDMGARERGRAGEWRTGRGRGRGRGGEADAERPNYRIRVPGTPHPYPLTYRAFPG